MCARQPAVNQMGKIVSEVKCCGGMAVWRMALNSLDLLLTVRLLTCQSNERLAVEHDTRAAHVPQDSFSELRFCLRCLSQHVHVQRGATPCLIVQVTAAYSLLADRR